MINPEYLNDESNEIKRSFLSASLFGINSICSFCFIDNILSMEIIIKYNGYESVYKNRMVKYITRAGVLIECSIPEDWGMTRIVQFMESLLKAELV